MKSSYYRGILIKQMGDWFMAIAPDGTAIASERSRAETERAVDTWRADHPEKPL